MVIFLLSMSFCIGNALAQPSMEKDSKVELREAKVRPYANDSPWNIKIGNNPEYEVVSDIIVSSFSGVFGSDPNQYTLPVYIVTQETPLVPIALSGTFSNVTENGEKVSLLKKPTVSVPIPDEAKPAKGSDGQIILWNPETGDEWGFWRIKRKSGSWIAKNGYHYNTNWSGVPPSGFLSRGAGIPYLTGLIRPWEIESGAIEHAIALGYNYPNMLFIHPATRSDSDSLYELLPMGARLQLNPLLTEQDFDRFGLARSGKIIARALQEYGMIVIDGSGHPKIYAEYGGTAGWKKEILNKNSIRKIPYTEFRVLKFDTPKHPKTPTDLKLSASDDKIELSWLKAPFASSYRINRMESDSNSFVTIAADITETTFVDVSVEKGKSYHYSVVGVSYNGFSKPSKIATITF